MVRPGCSLHVRLNWLSLETTPHPNSRKVIEKLGKTGKLPGHDPSQDELSPSALDSWMEQTFRTAWLQGMD
jgi:hypothetical protein